mgnify:CR=1 FL=1
MKRPFKDKRLMGPVVSADGINLSQNPTIAVLFLAKDGELLDDDRAENLSEDVKDKLSSTLGQEVQRLEIWNSGKVESAIGLPDNQGVYIIIEQEDKFIGKITATSNNQIEQMKQELVRTKGYGGMQDEWYVVGNGGSMR